LGTEFSACTGDRQINTREIVDALGRYFIGLSNHIGKYLKRHLNFVVA